MKMMILLVLLLIPTVLGLTNSVCKDTNTLEVNSTGILWIDGDEIPINKTEDKYCLYGCANNQCQPASLMSGGLFISMGLISAVLLVVGVLSKNKFFALIAGMIILVIGIYITAEGLVVDGILYEETVIRVIGIVLMIFAIFLFYSFAIDVSDTKKGNKGDFDE